MREQCERDRQPIREKIQQNRKEQAEQYLEERTADLLGKAHEKAQYEVCQACMFPLPSARPARQSSSSRPRSNSPPPLETDRLQFERKINVEGHRDGFRTVVRRVLRKGLGVDQRRAQEWAEKADYFIDWVVIEGCIAAVTKKNWKAKVVAGAAAILDGRGVYRYIRYDPGVITGAIRDKMIRFLLRKLKDSTKWKEKFLQ